MKKFYTEFFVFSFFRLREKYFLPLLLLLISVNFSFAQSISRNDSLRLADKHQKIADQQKRIDLFDYQEDRKVTLKNEDFTKWATELYFSQVDGIVLLIDSSLTNINEHLRFLGQLENSLEGVNEKSFLRFNDFREKINFISGYLEAKLANESEFFLNRNIFHSLHFISLYREEDFAADFLLMAAFIYPEEIFLHADDLKTIPNGKRIIEEAAKLSPMAAKKYLPTSNFVSQSLKKSEDSVVLMIMKIYAQYGMPSTSYALLDDIVSNRLTIDSAEKITRDARKYFDRMMEIRTKENPLAKNSLDQELEYASLEYVRVVNELHDFTNDIRFATVNDFTSRELYTLMVYTQPEIFTSTFLGFFDRMMKRMKTADGEEFLNSMGNNRYRTFVKMCVGYNTLDQYFALLTQEAKEKLLTGFVSNLEKNNGDLTQPVDVADTFGSIQDSSTLAFFQNVIKKEYNRVQKEGNEDGMILYGLLAGMFAGRATSDNDWSVQMSARYQLKPIDKIQMSDLFEANDTSTAYVVFYDDKDGEASFASFLSQYQDGNWKIERMDRYVKISSVRGKAVIIYANYPVEEYLGQPELMELFKTGGNFPNLVMHRGHSYYVPKTIEQISSNAKIVILGSCGGYHILNTVIERSPDVHIISSKQIGTMMVNDPLLHEIFETLRQGKDIEWITIWNTLDKKFKGNSDLYDKFSDYIPPHKNLGAIFIQAYNRLMQESFGIN